MKLQAVLFDLDGVITDTAEFHYQAWKQMAEQIGIVIDREFNESLKGISRMESLERILQHGPQEYPYTEAEKEALAAVKNKHYVSLLANLTPADTYPGIEALLLELKKKQIPAVIASASKNAPRILHALGIYDLFDTVVNPEGIPGKPAPDIFLQGARAIGADPACCVGIEDSYSGIQAIKSAGMVAVGIGEERILKPAGADFVYSHTAELQMSSLEEMLLLKA